MFVIYTNTCTPCKYRSQLNFINTLARERKTEVKIVETKYNAALLDEARYVSDIELPFVYNSDKRVSVRMSDVRNGQL